MLLTHPKTHHFAPPGDTFDDNESSSLVETHEATADFAVKVILGQVVGLKMLLDMG